MHPFRLSLLPFLLHAVVASRADAASAATAAPHDHTDEPVSLENLVVTAAPFKRDQAELAAATNVLAGYALELKQAGSLGAVLDGEPGIASTAFAPGASRPVIRGLGGDRVRVLDNGVGTIDASVASPDHAVSVEPMLADRIEVVRGPATLLYGGNAVGGVVNVLDGRIPAQLPDRAVAGRFEARGNTVARERTALGVLEGAEGRVAWRVDGLRRETDDLRIPGHARRDEPAEPAEPEKRGRLINSATKTTRVAGGLSVVGERGFLGAAATRLDTTYGTVAEPEVTIELKQRRLDLAGERSAPFGVFSGARAKLGLADYAHTEFEGREIGTRFKNKGHEGRVELLHENLAGLNGAWGAQTTRSDFSAIGEEAFLPPSLTTHYALFAFEELPVKPFTFQFGGRLERRKIAVDDGRSRRATTASASGGIVFKTKSDHVVALSLAHTERAPNAQELFADGPHLGTDAFEIGDAALGKEKSLGLDLGLRRRKGFVTGAVSVFANRFDGYVFEEFAGLEDPEHGLPVYRYVQRDVDFRGAELETIFHLHATGPHALDLRATADFVRARERRAGDSLPRITPRRATVALDFRGSALTASVAVQGVDRARHLAPGETATAGYALLSASVTYRFDFDGGGWEVFARGANLTDREARNHVSFLKDIAPLAGRDVTFGVRMSF